MITLLKGTDIANNVMMLRGRHRGAIIITEGPTDIRFYEHFFNRSLCQFVPAFNKDIVINAVLELDKRKAMDYFAIVDMDCWGLDNLIPPSQNIFMTDTHDVETMILSSSALPRILGEFGLSSEVAKLKKPITRVLLDGGLPIGFVRWLSGNTRCSLGLDFNKIDFNNFINDNLETDLEKFFQEIQTNCGLPTDFIKKQLRPLLELALKENAYDSWNVCCGHDLTWILLIGFKSKFGNTKCTDLSYEALGSVLRLSFDIADFSLTLLFNSIKKWEMLHTNCKGLI